MLKNLFFYGLLVLGAGLVLYLSWLPMPKMGLVWFIPGGVAHWADENRNDTIRTAVPLVGLGWWAAGWRSKTSRGGRGSWPSPGWPGWWCWPR